MKASHRDFIESALHIERVLDGAAMSTGINHRLQTARELEALGYVESMQAMLVDGDGFTIHPERWRTCWRVTHKGRMAFALEDAWFTAEPIHPDYCIPVDTDFEDMLANDSIGGC